MEKKTVIILCVLVFVVAAVIGGVLTYNALETNNSLKLTVNSVEDLKALVDQIYAGVSIEMPMVQTTEFTDKEMIQSFLN